jgi:ABC-type Fe3+/spermidine/putrescine transport system ATPase subunit
VSNLMPGTVRKSGDLGEVELDSGVRVGVGVNGFSPGDRCHAVVRPEKLSIGAGEPGAAGVDGLVESSVYLGTSTQLEVRLPDGVRMTVLVPNADEAERQRLPGGGATVKVSWRPEHMHLVRETEAASVETGREPVETT